MDHPRVLHKPTKGRAEVFSLETEDGANVVTSGEIWGVDELIFTLLKCKYIQMAPVYVCVCVSVPHTHTHLRYSDHSRSPSSWRSSAEQLCLLHRDTGPTSFVRSNNSAIFKFICLIPSFCVVSVCAAWITTASVSGHVYSKCSVWFFFLLFWNIPDSNRLVMVSVVHRWFIFVVIRSRQYLSCQLGPHVWPF